MSELDPNYVPSYEEVLATIIAAAVKAAIYWTLTGQEPNQNTPHELVDNTIRMHGAEQIVGKTIRAALAIHRQIVTVESTRVVSDDEQTTH